MKRPFSLFFLFILLISSGMTCKIHENKAPVQVDIENNTNPDKNRMSSSLKIKIGSRTFTATRLINATVTAFKARLPMTLSMKEMNGNEKFAELPSRLPTNSANPGTIQTGDLLLYGSNYTGAVL